MRRVHLALLLLVVSAALTGGEILWGDSIVWGTLSDDHIIWGTLGDGDTVVWGN